MNTFCTTIILLVSSFLYRPSVPTEYSYEQPNSNRTMGDTLPWHEKGARWLAEAQSKNGGWGSNSYAGQPNGSQHSVVTDPATTAFAALALLRAGGDYSNNPYQDHIKKALKLIIEGIESRPDTGKITSMRGTELQRNLGGHIDASIALEFLNAISRQKSHDFSQARIDSAAASCIRTLEASQNPNGSWAEGGYVPIIQTALSMNALSGVTNGLTISDSIHVRGSRYLATTYSVDGLKVDDAAGIPLYVASSIQRATAEDAEAVENILDEVVVTGLKTSAVERDNTVMAYAIESRGVESKKARRMARNYQLNRSATQALEHRDIWRGMGVNGGEEYLSYKMSSEALVKQDPGRWSKWKSEIEPAFIASQNPNGSWTGHHCINSPVVCTAAILQAWYAGN